MNMTSKWMYFKLNSTQTFREQPTGQRCRPTTTGPTQVFKVIFATSV